MEYEVCYLIGESKEANLETIRPGVEKIIEKHKGVFSEGEFVRKRRLAYVIKGEARGTYVARRFTIPTRDERDEMELDYDIMGEINKELRFNQDILRYMVVKTDDLPPLKDLELIEEKPRGQFAPRDSRREESKPMEKKVYKTQEVKKEVAAKKEVEAPVVVAAPVQAVAEKVEEVKEVEEVKAVEEVKEVKSPKKKTKKKDDEILGDDIDEKLDEILNI